MPVWVDTNDIATVQQSAARSKYDAWNGIRDGRNPSEIERPTFGFRVTKPFQSSKYSNKQFLVGMQGQVLHCKDDGAYVMCRDLFTNSGEPLKDWIARSCIEIGKQTYGSWTIDETQIPRTVSRMTAKEHEVFEKPDCKHLALGISTFLTTLAKTKPLSLTDESLSRLGGESGSKVPWITSRIIDGVKAVGVLQVLNDPKFTMDQLQAAAKASCSSTDARDKSGIYIRVYIEPPDPGRSRKKSQLYVGQSSNLYDRHKGWQKTDNAHKDLIAKCESVTMPTICVLEKVFYDDHKYIIEQVFVALLQTYQSDLLQRSQNIDPTKNVTNSHTKDCWDITQIAKKAAEVSGWTGAVQRKSFYEGSYTRCEGLNYQSPLIEAPKHEPGVWIRTDGYMPDPNNSNRSVPIANFTRAVPKKFTLNKASGASAAPFAIIFSLKSEDSKYQMRITRTLPKGSYKPGVDWPMEDSHYDLIFEVRTDWKPHPHSWARLPLIGPFLNWDRANCWAVSINWKDPSGTHRTKYLHCERPNIMMNKESPGSIQGYARGIEVIHWLFRERIPFENQHRWLQTVPMADVKVMKHNYVEERIKMVAGDPVKTTEPVTCQRKHDDDILREMNGSGVHGNFGLRNVGQDYQGAKDATAEGFGRGRRKCDTCWMIGRGIGLSTKCEQVDGLETLVCVNCKKLFGRPACSFTPNIPDKNTFADLDPRKDAATERIRTALMGLRGPPDSPDDTVTTDPVVFKVDQGDEIEEPTEADLKAAEAGAADTEEWGGP